MMLAFHRQLTKLIINKFRTMNSVYIALNCIIAGSVNYQLCQSRINLISVDTPVNLVLPVTEILL